MSGTAHAPTRLPCEGCGRCCTAPAFSSGELRRARLAAGGSYPPGTTVASGLPIRAEHGGGMAHMLVGPDGITCPFLTQEKRCAIYEARPRICQLYGQVPEMPCQALHPRAAERAAERLVTIGLGRGAPR